MIVHNSGTLLLTKGLLVLGGLASGLAACSAGDEVVFAYARTINSKGNGTNRDVLAEINESALLVKRDKGANELLLYQDTVLASYCGKGYADLIEPHRLLLRNEVKIAQHNGYELSLSESLGVPIRTPAPGLFPLLGVVSRLPRKSQWPGSNGVNMVEIDALVNEYDVKSVWCMSRVSGVDFEFSGPFVGGSKNGEVIIGGVLERSVRNEDGELRTSSYMLSVSIEKEAYLKSAKNNARQKDVGEFLHDATAVITVDSLRLQRADADGTVKLSLSEPVQDFMRKLKSTGKRPY